jgi:cobalt-zinc-cadmium efflux system membrane fusion protein
MNRGMAKQFLVAAILACSLAACGGKSEDVGSAGAPPPPKVQKEQEKGLLTVDHPSQFPLVKAAEYLAAPTLSVTGTVAPDVTRTVPVISLASGRVVEIRARLGDRVEKGQVLLRVQSPDIAGAFSDYRKAVADEMLASKQLDRAQLLYDKGAISMGNLQLAQDTEAKAKVDVETTLERLHVLGVDQDHPGGVVDIKAPVTGVITDQQVTNAAGVQGLSGANPFTISDLSSVWILCDVFENDLANVRVGETADITLNAYPDKKYTGRISNIGAILDPNLRTAKVRIQVPNPDMLMRVGMFVTAAFHGPKKMKYAAVPASAILHLHDRDWVYISAGDNKFKRIEVKTGPTLPDKMQEVQAGIEPGQEVISNALVFQNTVEQ